MIVMVVSGEPATRPIQRIDAPQPVSPRRVRKVWRRLSSTNGLGRGLMSARAFLIRGRARVQEIAEEAVQVVVLPITEMGGPRHDAAFDWHVQISNVELHSPADDIER